MLWCQGAQNTGLSNYKLKSALMCTLLLRCNRQMDRQTDEHHGNNATICSNEHIVHEKGLLNVGDSEDQT